MSEFEDGTDVTFDLDNLPRGLSEADLLDLIEGSLSDQRAREVRSLVASDQALSALVGNLSEDRSALGALEHPSAPISVRTSVRSHLRGEAIGNGVREPEVAYIPVSKVIPHEPGVLARLAEFLVTNGAARRLAVAAGFMLAAGLALWGGIRLISTTTTGSEQVAVDGGPSEPMVPPMTVVRAEPEIPAVTAPPVPVETSLAMNTDPAPVPTEVDSTAPSFSMPVAQASALAEERRLAIRILGMTPAIASARIDELRRDSNGRGASWTAMAREDEDALRVAMHLGTPSMTPVIADDGTGSAMDAVSPGGVYALRFTAGEAGLESVLRSMRALGLQVECIELDGPVELTAPDDIGDVVWWTRPPETWLPKSLVPVVIGEE